MSQLTNATTGTISVGQGSKITLQTAHTYMPSNIELTMNVTTANPQFDGGGLSVTSSASFSNINTSTTNNGILVQTKYLANRGAVLYNGAVAGWVSKEDNATALAATNNTSYTNGTAYYITGITVPNGKDFSLTTSGNSSSDTSVTTIVNGAKRNMTITNSGSITVNSGSNQAGTLQIAAYTSSSDTNSPTAQTVVENGVWKTYSKNPTTSAQGPFYGKTSITAVSKSDSLAAANIRSGQNVWVKGGTSTIYTIDGTFTAASTLTNNKNAITAATILSGYAGFINGNQVNGTMANNGATGGTITTQNGTYTIPAGYTTGGTVTATFDTTSVTQPTWTKNSSTKIVTTGNDAKAYWGTGYITASSMPAATFAASATSGITYLDLSDGKKDANNYIIPEIPSGGKLYISKGYIDNICIDLARLIPDASAVNNLSGSYILSGHSAYDNAGNLIVGTITTQSWPTAATSSATTGHTLQATVYALTTDQFINIPAGFYESNAYYKVNKLSSSNYSAANIKYNTTITVSNGNENVYSVKGSYTGDGTVTSTDQIRSGVIAYSKGTKYTGTMGDTTVTPAVTITSIDTYFDNGTSSSNSIVITPSYTNTPAGYLAAHSTAQNGTAIYKTIKVATFTGNTGSVSLVADTTSNSIYQSSSNTGNVSIESSAPAANSGYMYIKVSGSGSVKANTAGWITANTVATTNGSTTANGSGTRYVKIKKYDGTYTVT